MSLKKLSHAQRYELENLYEEHGWSSTRLAKKFGYSKGAIQYHFLINGISRPGSRRYSTPDRAPTYVRKGRTVRRFTDAEDERVLSMTLDGKNPTEVGRALGRGHHVIIARLATLARRDELTAEEAA